MDVKPTAYAYASPNSNEAGVTSEVFARRLPSLGSISFRRHPYDTLLHTSCADAKLWRRRSWAQLRVILEA